MSITAVDAVPITGNVHRDLAIISSLTFITPDGAHIRGDYVLVRIKDDSGTVGLGEASVTAVWSGETQAGTIAMIASETAGSTALINVRSSSLKPSRRSVAKEKPTPWPRDGSPLAKLASWAK